MPGCIGRQQSGQCFDKGIARRNGCATTGAFATQDQQVADERNVFQGGNPVAAGWAAGARFCERQRFRWRGFFAAEFRALGSPVVFHHPRQAVDDNIQKAADAKAQQAGGER
ncbi:hypothetical protein SDC9_195382 [bioreactor metagenome]|uniref:Uncharacterized protein n=1 Tax=bioreactor metagenome TaxID=1076179 RepID=A0A645I956_9ZZZZ